jgi:hypothetical protein
MPAATSARVTTGNQGKPEFLCGDATAVAVGAPDALPTVGLGSGIFSFTVKDRERIPTKRKATFRFRPFARFSSVENVSLSM